MKKPNKIKDYEEKAKVLRENGWTDLWHPDNWVKEEWRNHPTIDIDRAGVSTNIAYRSIVPFELIRDNLDELHDLVVMVTSDLLDEPKYMSDEELRELWKNLPRDLKEIGMDLGLSDNSFKMGCYNFLEQALKLIK